MATYLVTGAAGFVGAKVCEFLLADRHMVVGIDNLNDYYDVRLKDYRLANLLGLEANDALVGSQTRSRFAGAREYRSDRFIFRHGDIEDFATLDALFGEFRFDAVLNLAARAGVRASMANPHVFLSTNTEGALNILECQRKHGVCKQVLASTSSLYAGCPMPFTEDQPVNTPLSPYAAAKKAAELMAYSYHRLYGLDISVVRYFTVYGPAGRPDMAPFRFIKWIEEGTPVRLFGDGSQSRDFTFVDDIARGTILAARPLGYEIINLGGGRQPITLHAFIEHVERALGKKASIVEQHSHVADVYETWADIAKAARLLDWEPRVVLEDGIRQTVTWHVSQRDWLRTLHV